MITPNNYYNVQGWMITELGLKGNELAAYAIIYGFSQDGASVYSGSSRYLSEWLNCSKRTVLTILANLTEKGYIIKTTVEKNGVIFNDYTAVRKPGESPGAPPPGDERQQEATKHKYGEYKNVLLTDEELESLKKQFPTDYNDRIERLSEYIASTGKKYKSHFATIRAWKRRETTGKPGRKQAASNVGPNGIAIDPTKTDLDAIF